MQITQHTVSGVLLLEISWAKATITRLDMSQRLSRMHEVSCAFGTDTRVPRLLT